MPTVYQAFESLMQNLELSESEQAEASCQQNVLRDNLRNRLTLDRDFLSGSYTRKTAIRPLNDIDCFLVLNEKTHDHLKNGQPEAALKVVQKAQNDA